MKIDQQTVHKVADLARIEIKIIKLRLLSEEF